MSEKLAESLRLIREELGFVVDRCSKTKVMPAEFEDFDFYKQWKEVEVAFDKASHMLHDVSVEALENHGLIGRPLEAKLTFLYRARDEVHRRIEEGRVDMVRKLLSWLLGVLDNLLESLGDVLPPLGAVKEFKKQVKSGLEFP